MNASRVAAGGAAVLLCASLAAGCVRGDELVTDRSWQITGVFINPGLPTAPTPDDIPPVLAFGAKSYTGSTSCGEFQGTLTWRDGGIVAIGEPEVVRTSNCSVTEADYQRRLFEVLPGEQQMEVDGAWLRAKRIVDHPQGEAAPGFRAVEVGAELDG